MNPIKTDAELAELLDLFVALEAQAAEAGTEFPRTAAMLEDQAAKVRRAYYAERVRVDAVSNMAVMVMDAERRAYEVEANLATSKARGFQSFSMVAPAGGAGIGVGSMSDRELYAWWERIANQA
jgi:hypothetical protein